MPKRPLQQRTPGSQRLQLADDEQGDVVGLIGVGGVVLILGRLGDAGEHLQRDIAFLQARQVYMAALCRFQHVALPQQRVAVQVNYGERFVKCARLLRDLRQRLAVDLVALPLHDTGGEGKERDSRQ